MVPASGPLYSFNQKISPYYQNCELFTFLHAFSHNHSYWSLFSFLLKFSNSLSQHFRLWSFGCLPNQMVAQHLTQLCRYFAPPLSLFFSSLFSPLFPSPPFLSPSFFSLLSLPPLSFVCSVWKRYLKFQHVKFFIILLQMWFFFRFCSFLNEPYEFCLLSLNWATVTIQTIITWNRIPSCIAERLGRRCLTPV